MGGFISDPENSQIWINKNLCFNLTTDSYHNDFGSHKLVVAVPIP